MGKKISNILHFVFPIFESNFFVFQDINKDNLDSNLRLGNEERIPIVLNIR